MFEQFADASAPNYGNTILTMELGFQLTGIPTFRSVVVTIFQLGSFAVHETHLRDSDSMWEH